MRYIPANCLKPGMICGKKILGRNGQVLLNQGAKLQTGYIERILDLGFSGVYIEDDLSEDIQIEDVIPDQLRHRSVKTLKKLFSDIKTNRPTVSKTLENIDQLVDFMLDEIIDHRDIQVNLLDVKIFDDYTYFHSVNVGVLSLLLGTVMDLKRNQLHQLGMSAILHDVGKIFIPKRVLNKPGRLSPQEFDIMKSHSEKGYQYLFEQYDMGENTLSAVMDHHEKLDGSGYPAGKKRYAISRFGRIIAVADVFDALTSDRPYRKALPPAEAIEFIMGGSDSLFDAKVVGAFLQKIVPYSLGTTVHLSNHAVGIVIENHSHACLRPVVRVFSEDGKDVEPYALDLLNDRNALDITIIESEL